MKGETTMEIDNDAVAGTPPEVQLADCRACGQRVPVIRMFSEPHDWRFAIHNLIAPARIRCASSATVSAGPFYPLEEPVAFVNLGTLTVPDAPGDDGQTHQAEPMPDDAPDCVCVMIDRHAQGAFTFTTAKRPDDYVPAGVIEIIPPQKSEGERYIRIVIWNKETA